MENVDHLSSNPVLVDICEYLNSDDVITCSKLSRRFKQIIDQHKPFLAKPKRRLWISSNEANFKIHEHIALRLYAEFRANNADLTFNCSVESPMVTRILVRGKFSKKFVRNYFQRYSDNSIIPAPNGFEFGHPIYSADVKGDIFTILRNVLDEILGAVDVIKVALDKDLRGDKGSPYYQSSYTPSQLEFLGDFLSRRKLASRRAAGSSLLMIATTPLHWNILHTQQWTSATVGMSGDLLSVSNGISLPNVRRLILIMRRPQVTRYSIEQLLMEFAESNRSNRYLSIRSDEGRQFAFGFSKDELFDILPPPLEAGNQRHDSHGMVTFNIGNKMIQLNFNLNVYEFEIIN